MRYCVIGRRGALAFVLGVCLCIAATATAVGQLGKAIQVDAGSRLIPIYSVDTDRQMVALGINCAWEDKDIPQILKALKEEDVKATFFVVGQWAEQYPESVRAIHDAGHEIGNHSYSHPDMTTLSREEMQSQLQRCNDAVKQAAGVETTLFRAPSGAYNNAVLEVARQEGYETIQWSDDTRDWKKLTVEQIVQNGAGHVKNGSILLLHSGAQNTAEALPELLRTLRAKGYSFCTVGELIYRGDYTVDVQGRQHKE